MSNDQHQFWNSYFKAYDILNRFIPYETMLQAVSSELAVNQTDHFLDLGCGTGNLLRFIPKNASSVASDFSSEALSIARHKEVPDDCRFLNIDLTEPLPFDPESFSKIALVNVLYAFSSSQQCDILSEVKRILKPGGKTAIVMPKPHASRFKIFKTHVREMIKHQGAVKTVTFLFTSSAGLFRMNRYNRIIESKAKQNTYQFQDPATFIDLLESFGFHSISASDTYAGQAVLYSFSW